MGRNARRRHGVEPQGVNPQGHVVRFEELEYKTLRLYIRDADAAIAEAQVKVNTVLAARDAYMAQMAAKYGFDAKGFTKMQWDDATSSFSFIP